MYTFGPFRIVEIFFYKCIKMNTFIAVFYVICHRLGIVKRLLQLWIEHEAKKVCVTCVSFLDNTKLCALFDDDS